MTARPDPRFPVALDDLAARHRLSPRQTGRLSAFAALLAYEESAPTSVRDPTAILDDHLADALVALELPQVRAARTLADLGAGAGVPGIPLAIALPRCAVTLLDGSGRKCEFMRLAVAELRLRNAEVVHSRAETWQAGFGGCELVTARALAPLDVVEEYAAPLLRVGGSLVAWRGRRDPDAERAAARAAEILGLAIAEPMQKWPYQGAHHRHLHVISKLRETPERFPRREGAARKRPLGGAGGGR